MCGYGALDEGMAFQAPCDLSSEFSFLVYFRTLKFHPSLFKNVTFYSKEEAQAELHESFLHEEESLSWVWSCGRV